MIPKVEVKHATQWLSLKTISWPEKGINGYDYIHEEKTNNGMKIAALPFRTTPDGDLQFLLRKEIVPCWDIENQALCALTGTVEKDSDPTDTVLNEIEEEAGYTISENDLIYLGPVRSDKMTDSMFHLFAADVSDYEQGEALGDGSEGEALASSVWVNGDEIWKAEDSLPTTLFIRFLKWLQENTKK